MKPLLCVESLRQMYLAAASTLACAIALHSPRGLAKVVGSRQR
ncbi:MAG: hypothetical protein ACFLMY_10680 [Candidatus Brachytrichaceae bacterium NZ_4S206]